MKIVKKIELFAIILFFIGILLFFIAQYNYTEEIGKCYDKFNNEIIGLYCIHHEYDIFYNTIRILSNILLISSCLIILASVVDQLFMEKLK